MVLRSNLLVSARVRSRSRILQADGMPAVHAVGLILETLWRARTLQGERFSTISSREPSGCVSRTVFDSLEMNLKCQRSQAPLWRYLADSANSAIMVKLIK